MDIDLGRGDERRGKEGEPPLLWGFLLNFVEQYLGGGKSEGARGGASRGTNSGHQDDNHNSIKRLLTYSVTQGGR